MKKLLALVLALCMVLSLAACAGSGNNGNNSNDVNNDNNGSGIGYELDENTPAWQLDKRENTKLTWYVNADWWNKSWNEDVVTRQMKKDLNLDIEFLTGDDTVLNGLVAGGEYPDIITVFGNTSDLALRADQWAYSLQELADTYDPYFYKVARQESLDWFQLSDGKTYGYPNYSNTQEDYDSGDMYITDAFVIREDVYEALGRPSMKTQEEFLDVLNQIKEKYPDLVPLGFNDLGTGTGSLGDKLQDMLGVPLANEDNSFYDRNLDEDYLSWLRTLRQAHENGCISDDSFSDDGTLFQEKITIGKYACIIMSGISQQSGFLTTFTNNTGVSYIAIDGPQSTVGREPTMNQSGISGWMVTFISKTCQDPAKAIQTFTYLISDYGQILTTYGIEGETYTIDADGKYVLNDDIKELQSSDNDRYKKEIRLGEFCIFGHDRYKALSPDAYPEAIHQFQEWGLGKLKGHFILESTSPDNGTPEARANDAITSEWATTLGALILSGSDAEFDQILANYKQFLADNDYEAVCAIKTEKMQANAEKLGY